MDIQILSEQLTAHTQEDKDRFSEIKLDLGEIKNNVNNHLPTAIGELKIDIAFIRGMLESKQKNGNGHKVEDAVQNTKLDILFSVLKWAGAILSGVIVTLIIKSIFK